MTAARWSIAGPSGSVDPDGTAVIVADLDDAAALQGTLTVRLTPDRALSVLWQAADGAAGLADFQAWER